MSLDPTDISENKIIQRLASAYKFPQEARFPPELQSENPRPAAVLIPLLRKNGAWHLLFTRRTNTLAEHGGQVAFPGGRSDPEDTSPIVTALREAHEEINLQPDEVRILGKLHELPTITNYWVTPVVGAIPWPYQVKLKSDEVSRVFTIPLVWLCDPTNRRIQKHVLPPPYSTISVVHFNPHDGETLWGVSAQITVNFLKSLQLI